MALRTAIFLLVLSNKLRDTIEKPLGLFTEFRLTCLQWRLDDGLSVLDGLRFARRHGSTGGWALFVYLGHPPPPPPKSIANRR